MSVKEKKNRCKPGLEAAKNSIKGHRILFIDCKGREFFLRSNWEIQYACWLDEQNFSWDYEPGSFELSIGKNYIPDFYIWELDEFHEVKGYMSDIAILKINSFYSDYPNINLKIINDKNFNFISKKNV